VDIKNEKLFSMPRKKLVSYVESGKYQLKVLHQLILYQLDQEIEYEWLISNLCDSYSANYKLVHEWEYMIEVASDEEKSEVLMTRDDLTIIEAILTARHYTNREIRLHGALSIMVH